MSQVNPQSQPGSWIQSGPSRYFCQYLSIFLFFANFFPDEYIIEQIDHYTPVYSHYYATIVFYEGVCRQICLVIFHILILCSRMCPQTHCDQIPQFLHNSLS